MNARFVPKIATICAVLAIPAVANAAFVDFYSLTSAGTVKKVNSPLAVAGLTVSGGQTTPATSTQPLTVANYSSELGLGVCGSADIGATGNNLCDTNYAFDTEYASTIWNGQLDELENLGNAEFITINEATADLTGQFKLGSFDGTESGYVTDGTNTTTFKRQSDGTVVLVDNGSWTSNISNVFGNVWLLTITGFDSTISSVTFGAGCGAGATGCGTDNDYLVASASVVPIPAALPLFMSALAGVGLIGWRRGHTAKS